MENQEPESTLEEIGDEIQQARQWIKEKLGDLPGLLRVHVTRKSPNWCAGYQATFECDEGFSLDLLKEHLGGGRYIMKFIDDQGRFICSRDVLIGGQPREDGILIDDPLTKARKQAAAERRAMIEADNQKRERNEMGTIVEIMQSQQNQFLTLITALLGQQRQTTPERDPINDLLRYHQLFKVVQGTGPATVQPPDETAHILGKLIDVLGNKNADSPPLLGAAALGSAIAQTAGELPLVDRLAAMNDHELATLVSGFISRNPDRINTLLNEIDPGATVDQSDNGGINADDSPEDSD